MSATYYYDRMIYHLVNELAKFVPWIMKEGEPSYPTNPLWKSRSGLGDLTSVKLTCDSTNMPNNVQAKDSLNKLVEIDFSWDSANKKETLNLKYDGVIEATMTEQVKTNGDLEFKKTVPGVSANDLTVLVKKPVSPRPPHGYFDVEITLGTVQYNGKIIPYSTEVPTFIQNFLTGLQSITTRTVTALAPELMLPFGNWIYSFDLGDLGEKEPPPLKPLALINLIAVIVDDFSGNNSWLSALQCCIIMAETEGNPII